MPAGSELFGVGMQLLPPLTSKPNAHALEQPAGKHLPYARHLDDHTIETRDGLLMQFVHVRGLLFETADTDEINYRKQLREAMLRAAGSARFAIYHHIVRRESDAALPAEYQDAFSKSLDESWRANLAAKRLYSNDLYLTIVRRPLGGKLGLLAGLRKRLDTGADRSVSAAYERQQLNQATDAILASLSGYVPRLLTVYDTPPGPCSEPLEFLSYLFNGEMRPVLLPIQDLGEYLPYRRISFGEQAVELG